jgi:transcriptional antiterminator RfaH
MLVDMTSVSRVWVVVSVKPRMEGSMEALLSREGIESYCPKFKKRASDPRIRTLFPGYLFLYLSPKMELVKIRTLPGIRRPLMFHDQVACIEEDLVEGWKSREAGRGFAMQGPSPAFRPGQRLRIREGSFGGLSGVVLENLPAKQRVKLLLEHLGMSLQVEVDSDILH